jgi:hypothetical protein
MAALSLLLIPMVLFVRTEDPDRWAVLAMVPVCFALALLAYSYVKTAKRLRSRDPQAAKMATLLAIPLLFGFPIFTIAGLYCFVLLGHYPAYLIERE